MNTKDQQVVLHVFTTLSELANTNSEKNISKFLAKSKVKIPSFKEEEDTEGEEEKGNESQEDDDKLLTVKQFADYFLVSENSAREWIKRGYVKFIRIGKRIRIRKAEILAMEKRRSP